MDEPNLGVRHARAAGVFHASADRAGGDLRRGIKGDAQRQTHDGKRNSTGRCQMNRGHVSPPLNFRNLSRHPGEAPVQTEDMTPPFKYLPLRRCQAETRVKRLSRWHTPNCEKVDYLKLISGSQFPTCFHTGLLATGSTPVG